MKVHLVDGTYELFRYHFALPSHVDRRRAGGGGHPRAWSARCSRLLEDGATHVGVATDHVIESFRNDLWPGYKTERGHAARAARPSSRCSRTRSTALGVTCARWSSSRPTTPWARPRAVAAADPRVEQVLICTPDKDLGQCVVGDRVVQLDRRKERRRSTTRA